MDEHFCLKIKLFRAKLFSTLGNDRGSDPTDGAASAAQGLWAGANLLALIGSGQYSFCGYHLLALKSSMLGSRLTEEKHRHENF